MNTNICQKAEQLTLTLVLLLALTTGVSAAGHTGNQADDLAAVALGQLGYTEGLRNDTPFGKWYGLPNQYWCAMFVSWCAREANISEDCIPQFSGCTGAMKWFERRGLWQDSQWIGGSYVPLRGDLILFNWTQGTGSNHVGIVLQTDGNDVYTVEGNTLTYRWIEDVSTFPEPLDRVVVKRYPLSSNEIRGFATPAYTGREIAVPPASGFVDLADYAEHREEIVAVVNAKLLPPMNASFFGELYQVSRGDFISALVNLFAIDEMKPDTRPFSDVPQDSPFYQTTLAARSAGILLGDLENNCVLDAPLTTEAADIIVQRASLYLQGNLPWTSFPAGTFVERGPCAVALYRMMADAVSVSPVALPVLLNGEQQTLVAYQSDAHQYVSLDMLRRMLEHTNAAFTSSWSDEEGVIILQCVQGIQEDNAVPKKPITLVVPAAPAASAVTGDARRTLRKTVQVRVGETTVEVAAVTVNSETFYQLDSILFLQNLEIILGSEDMKGGRS